MDYTKSLLENHTLVSLSAIWGAVSAFLFPEAGTAATVIAVLGIMTLDLLTRVYALSKEAGSFWKAILSHRIASSKLAKGTLDKLILFGVVLIICGLLYHISKTVAAFLRGSALLLMALRDALSIFENLEEAGVTGLGMFKKIIRKKYDEISAESEAIEEAPEQPYDGAQSSSGEQSSLEATPALRDGLGRSMKIALDAGHGSNTAGKRTPPFPFAVDIDGDGDHDIELGEQYREHYANVGVCVRLERALLRCGFGVLRVAWDDENGRDDPDLSLAERQARIRSAGCDISVSIHFNAFGDGRSFNSADGVCTFIHSNPARVRDSWSLAVKVAEQLAKGTKQRNRGVLADAFAMCNCAAMGTKASILCELAFMTNLRKATQLMASESFWTECAEEICRGICAYAGKPYVEPKLEEAIGKLAGLGVINTPDYWLSGHRRLRYLDLLLIKAAEKITDRGTPKDSAEEGIEALVSAGVIDSPDYWTAHKNDIPYMGDLLRKLGGGEYGKWSEKNA